MSGNDLLAQIIYLFFGLYFLLGAACGAFLTYLFTQ